MDMKQCIGECTRCHQVCTATVQHCLGMRGKHAEPDHIRLMLDCAQICQVSAGFMLRGSDLHKKTCGVCAVVCKKCAADCARMGEDRMMKKCADQCRKCAEICAKMAA